MESIGRFVLEQLAAWEVPGCAVAAVKDGHILLTAGWGQRDLDTGLPVTPETLFAIGSTTKAFTAATVGALVDDGLLEWERPLRDYVPELRLSDPVVTDRLTVVDLLSHRSGLPRHEMVWLGHPGRSRAEIVCRLRFLLLSKDLRQAFQYCNLGYLLAGHTVEVLGGTPWEDFLRTRLLTPLGMGRSTLSVDDMTADPDHATARRPRRSAAQAPGRLRRRVRASRLRHAHHRRRGLYPAAAPGHAGPQPGAPPLRDVRPGVARTRRPVPPAPAHVLVRPGGDITALTVPFESAVEPLRFDRLPDAQARDPEVSSQALRYLRHGLDRGRGGAAGRPGAHRDRPRRPALRPPAHGPRAAI